MSDSRLLTKKEQLFSLIMKELSSPDTIIQSFKPNFFERINSMLTLSRPVVVAISGESASGKTTFVRVIKEQAARIQERRENTILSTIKGDNYFNDISKEIQKHGSFNAFLETGYNPDAPESFELELMRKDLGKLMNGENARIPMYQINGTGISLPEAVEICPAEVIIVEGMCSLYDDIHDVFDLKIFVDIDEETQRSRYLSRCAARNQSIQDGEEQLEIVTNSAKAYIRPTKKYADIIINGNSSLEDIKTFALEFIKALGSTVATENIEDEEHKALST